ncbi:GNAT family N-acetyltransferase [Xanthomonas maliensis]|uniref:GNAT family N-acetyltransferase n=1 Tax=Xanthomonas maliensis TaxID=1321368 RepID=UPI00039F27DD|nr:GNAT family N-acetyltransferase [Xanthomonas maliensis]KAB7771341.1 GNAT family N-acetyltransferase [Xanthomonas maliensis]
MKLRAYRDDDWSALCAVHDAARQEELRAAGLAEAFLPLSVAAEREGLFVHYQLRVAVLDERVVGFVAYDAHELAWLYVAPDVRRRGVGMALVEAAKQAHPAGLTLELLEGNRAALGFYRRCGFVETGSHRGRMPGNERFMVSVWTMQWSGQPAAAGAAGPVL